MILLNNGIIRITYTTLPHNILHNQTSKQKLVKKIINKP